MLIARIPRFFSRVFPGMTWSLDPAGRSVYITFDDGPTPGVTDWVLEVLKQYDARATFFCLGKNVRENPEIFQRINDQGHSVGNHTYSHLKGFGSGLERYLGDIKEAHKLIESNLFRPPYGRILADQARALRADYRIIMWSVLSVDYNRKLSGDRVTRNVVENVKPGSIVVFHDSEKARKNLEYALPRVLAFLKKEGYDMKAIMTD